MKPIDPKVQAAWADHNRHFDKYHFVYPVISRRAQGISLGINLNPDGKCNFDCPYCQVDRTIAPPIFPNLTPETVKEELTRALEHWKYNRFTDSPRFQSMEDSLLGLKDICLSGDGEATTVPFFSLICQVMADVQQNLAPEGTKLVLITNATRLQNAKVQEGLAFLTKHNGEIWGKLDAGTQEHFERMSRSVFQIDQIEKNLTDVSQKSPLRIQTMLCAWNGDFPSQLELETYAERLKRIASQATTLLEVQLYTVVRRTATDQATPLPKEFLEETAQWLAKQISVPVGAY